MIRNNADAINLKQFFQLVASIKYNFCLLNFPLHTILYDKLQKFWSIKFFDCECSNRGGVYMLLRHLKVYFLEF